MIQVAVGIIETPLEIFADLSDELRQQQTAFSTLLFVGWLAVWFLCELAARRRSSASRSRWVSHLRYAPLAIACFSVAFVLLTDGIGIQYSRWQISRYVYGNASPHDSMPTLELYNDYRGFCGNGMAGHEYWLYGETAAAGLESDDPRVRARALRATASVYDWLNNSRDGRFMEILIEAGRDPDPLVRELAAKYWANMNPSDSSE
jgi:hypothetical protein